MDSFEQPINYEILLGELFNTPHQHRQQQQQPTTSSPVVMDSNSTRPTHHASSSISSTTSFASTGRVWSEQDIEELMRISDNDDDDNNIQQGLSLSHSHRHGDLELEHTSLNSHQRSMALSSQPPGLPACPPPGSIGYDHYFAPDASAVADNMKLFDLLPAIPLTTDVVSRMHIPCVTSSASTNQQQQQQQQQQRRRRQTASMNSNGYYSILPAFPLEGLPNVDATTLYPHLQQLCNHQLTTTAITTSMPAVASPFYGMPLDIDMADLHQNTTLLNSNLPIMLETSANSDIADFQSTSALLIHGMPAAVPVPSTSLPLYDYNTNKPTIDTNSPEYLSYLSSLAQQQQQYKQRQVQIHQQLQQQLQRQLTESKSITSNPQHQHQQHQQQQPYHINTTALPHATNRDPVQTTTTFLRPVNATNFEQTMYPTTTVEPTNDAAIASLPLAADASIQRRRRGRPPLDRMPSFSSTPPLSPQVPTLTATPASTPNSTLSRSSSNSSTSSRSSRQSSPQSFFIMPPYQHSDHKVDRRSFNSRKQLKQARARAAAEEEKEEAREEQGSERGREFE